MNVKVLIAEDEDVSRSILQRTIESWGHEVIATSDGAEAWRELQSTEAPMLAILDLTMPEMDGAEVCRKVRKSETSKLTYIILLTVRTDIQDIVAGLEAGANDYLTKPFDNEELRARLNVGARVVELQSNLAERVTQLEQALMDREHVEDELRKSEHRYRHLVESSLGLIFTHDEDGTFLSVNPASAKVFGYEPDEIVGKNLRDFVTPSSIVKVNDYLDQIRREQSCNGLFYFQTKSGEERVVVFHNSRYEDRDAPAYILGHAQDVTELKRAEEALRNLSLTDELTGLYNRRGFFALAEQFIKSIRRSNSKLLLVYADMDGLKQINDTLGHNAGSQALMQMAGLLRHSFRESDIAARMGGDEFTVLAIIKSEETTKHLIYRLHQNLQLFNKENKLPYTLSFSIGFVSVGADEISSIEDLLAKADALMYEEKKNKSQNRAGKFSSL